jgi:hypothetical protein
MAITPVGNLIIVLDPDTVPGLGGDVLSLKVHLDVASKRFPTGPVGDTSDEGIETHENHDV